MSQEHSTTVKATNIKSKEKAFKAFLRGEMKVSEFINIYEDIKKYLPSRMLKNYQQMVIQSILKDQECLKSPFGKGGFSGISGSYKIPPNPPLEKGGIKTAPNQA